MSDVKPYLVWKDEAIGKSVKNLAKQIDDHFGEKSKVSMACALLLASEAALANAAKSTIALDGVSTADTECGDWEVEIRRRATPTAPVDNTVAGLRCIRKTQLSLSKLVIFQRDDGQFLAGYEDTVVGPEKTEADAYRAGFEVLLKKLRQTVTEHCLAIAEENENT